MTMAATATATAYVHHRYLDAEERYEIFVVKAAERPHLLHWSSPVSGDASKQQSPRGCGGGDDDDGAAQAEDGHDEKKIDDDRQSSHYSYESLSPPLTDGCDIPGWRSQRIAPGMNPHYHYSNCIHLQQQPAHDHDNNKDINDRCNNEKSTTNIVNDDTIDIEYPLNGTLNIGAGSTLTRLESQFPFVTSSLYYATRNNNTNYQSNRWHQSCCCCWWHHAKQQFRFSTSSRIGGQIAPTIEYDEAKRMVDNYDNISTTSNNHHRQQQQQQQQQQPRQITYFVKEYEIKNRPVKIMGVTKGWLAMPSYSSTTKSFEDTNIASSGRLRAQDNGITTNNSSSSINKIASSLWRDVGEESLLFHGGGKGGWTFANLLSRFGNISFRFSDTHGEMMSLSTYAKYITNPEGLLDDSPLGIYDSEFGEEEEGSSPISELLKEYCVPECFSRDLFDLVDTDDDHDGPTPRRPPYRWILIGPERSGTGMHVDPLWTNAWVTILQGQKHWLLFPPDTPYSSIGMIEGSPQIPSSIWFRDYYDVVTSPSWPKQYQPVEVLQNPGETVFVPAGWPHLVLNLELTVAVTHNYASEYGPHFDRMWEEVVRDEPDFASRWLAGLKKNGREDLTACMTHRNIMSVA